jgi:hypothetical protein
MSLSYQNATIESGQVIAASITATPAAAVTVLTTATASRKLVVVTSTCDNPVSILLNGTLLCELAANQGIAVNFGADVLVLPVASTLKAYYQGSAPTTGRITAAAV